VKALIGVVEVVGAYVTLAQTRDKETKILGVSLGWALGDAVARRLIPLWLGATGYDWDPTYLLLAIDANVYLVHCIVFVTLVWLHSRPLLTYFIFSGGSVCPPVSHSHTHSLCHSHSRRPTPCRLSLLPMCRRFLQAKVGLNEFAAVALRALLTLFFGLIAYRLYKYDLSNSEKKKSS